MEDIYNTNVNNNGNKDHRPFDEMSLFVHQILLRSSSSSSCSSFTAHNEGSLPPSFSAPPYRSGMPSGCYFSSNVSSLAVGGVIENDNDECDWESEEGVEAVVDEEPVKRGPLRSSSKRSRAAEVHNLSEKRRRSRINEKMKALQNLIPNSNKTDKASMLDEAIEYLKQLQLQVQMLSMRNGISLHPMCMPELLLPIQHFQSRTRSHEENWSQQMDISGSFSLRQESSEHTMFGLPNQCTPSNHPSLPNMSSIVNSETSSGMESSIQGYLGSYLFHTPSEGILREYIVSNQLLNAYPPDRKLSEFEMGDTDTKSSFPFKTQAPNLKDCSSVAGCEMGRDQTNEVLVKNVGQNLMSSSELNSIQTEKGTYGG